jgi:hypothetical protein
MTSNYIYHYVYRITNLITRTHYYGVRSCNIHPTNDIGVKYFGSLTKDEGKYFRIDQRANPQNFRYKIVRILPTREAANTLEIIFHHKFDVGINPKFYNKAKALSTGFDVTGRKGRKNGPMSQEHRDKISVARLGSKISNERKGEEHHRFDKTIFSFYNKKIDMIFIGTKFDFRQKFGGNASHLASVTNGKVKSIFGWCLHPKINNL